MKVINKNIFANFVGKTWNFVSIYLFVRIYIQLLGINSYAIINFYSVILGLFTFVNAGLTLSINREMASNDSLEHKSTLLYTFQSLFFIIGAFFVFLVFFFSDFISNNFLNSSFYSRTQISYYVKIMGVGIFFQMYASLYEGGLLGLQKQVFVNIVNISWGVFRSALVIIPLYFKPSVELYFYWQILSNALLFVILRYSLWKHIRTKFVPSFSTLILKEKYQFLLGAMFIALISAVNIQIDKLITSHLLDLNSFGQYALASTMAQIPLVISTPIILAVFPIFSNLVHENNQLGLVKYFHKYSFLITSISFPVVFVIFLFSFETISIWTGNVQIAENVNYILKIMVLGGFFVCLQLVPYYIAISRGHTKTNIYIGMLVIVIEIPLLFYCINSFGLIGASLPWLLMNFISCVLMTLIIIRKFFASEYFSWLIYDILVPITVVSIIAYLIYLIPYYNHFQYTFIFKSVLIISISLTLNLWVYSYIKSEKY